MTIQKKRKNGSRSLPARLALILLLMAACLCRQTALAVPAYPGVLRVKDGTGNVLSVRNHGDEFFSYTTTTAGELLYRDEGGFYYYVLTDGSSFAVGPQVFEEEPLLPQTLPDASAPTDAWRRVHAQAQEDGFQQKLEALYSSSGVSLFGLEDDDFPLQGYMPEEGIDPLFHKWADEMSGSFRSPPSPAKGGVCPLLVLKIEYEDIPCLFDDEAWSERIFGARGVSAYYNEVSGGRFTYVPARETCGMENDGVITVKLPINHPLYAKARTGHNYASGAQAGLYDALDDSGRKYAIYGDQSLFAYGVEAADPYINFALYDRACDEYFNGNSDGYLTSTELAVLVVNAGYEAAIDGNGVGDPATWATSWIANDTWLPDPNDPGAFAGSNGGVLLDEVLLYKYTIMGENLCASPDKTEIFPYDYSKTLEANQSNGCYPRQAQVGTACHELGHDLGLVDLYDLSNSSVKVEYVEHLSLMSSGAWGYATTGESAYISGSSPTHLDAYSKAFLGFYEPQVISASGVYSVTEASNSSAYNILRVNTDNPDVYYLIENRTFTGFDEGMQAGFPQPGGVVYWRIDEQVIRDRYASNTINSVPGPYGIVPEYVYYSNTPEYSSYNCIPYRNQETIAEYPAQTVFTLPEKPSFSLLSYDPTSSKMDVWLNASTPIALALYPDNSFVEERAERLYTVLGEGSNVTPEALESVALSDYPMSSPNEYRTDRGSIIVELEEAFLNRLPPNHYTLQLTLRNGMTAEAELTVSSADASPAQAAAGAPKTGDASMPGLWAALLALSLGGLAFLWRRRANRYSNSGR